MTFVSFALFWVLRLFCFLSHYVFAEGWHGTRVEVIGELAVVGSNFTGNNLEGPALKDKPEFQEEVHNKVKPSSSFSV